MNEEKTNENFEKKLNLLISDGGEALIVDSPADLCAMPLCRDAVRARVKKKGWF